MIVGSAVVTRDVVKGRALPSETRLRWWWQGKHLRGYVISIGLALQHLMSLEPTPQPTTTQKSDSKIALIGTPSFKQLDMSVRLNPGTPQQSHFVKRSLQRTLQATLRPAPTCFQSSASTPLDVLHRHVFSHLPVDSKITTQL